MTTLKRDGLLIVVSGPSGAGKGTVLAHAIKKYHNLQYSVSVTTRAPRPGEKDGINYYFVTKEQFKKMIEQDEFLEYQEVYGNFYGTPKSIVLDKLKQGKDVVLEIDVKGALDIKNKFPEALMVFLTPTNKETIAHRLRGRSTESEEQLAIRINSAIDELKQAVFYDYIVINEDAELGANDIISIIKANKCCVSNNKKFINDLIYGGTQL